MACGKERSAVTDADQQMLERGGGEGGGDEGQGRSWIDGWLDEPRYRRGGAGKRWREGEAQKMKSGEEKEKADE